MINSCFWILAFIFSMNVTALYGTIDIPINPKGKTNYMEINRRLGLFLKTEKEETFEFLDSLNDISEQRNNDTLKALYLHNLSIYHYNESQIDSSLKYNLKANNLFENIELDSLLTKSYNYTGAIYLKKNNFDKAEEYFLKTTELRKKLGMEQELISAMNNLAVLYLRYDKYDKALEYNIELLKHYEKIESEMGAATTKYRIGNIYYYMNDTAETIRYYKEALKTFQQENEPLHVARTLTGLGAVYYENHKNDKALEYYLEALDISNNLKNYRGRGILLNNVGLIYKQKGNYREALKYIKNSIKVREDNGKNEALFHPYTSLAEINLKLGNYQEALNYIDSAETIAKKLDQNKLYEILYNIKFRIYEDSGNYKKALESYKQYSAVSDSLLSHNMKEKIAELEVQYETEKKEQENIRLRHINQLQLTYFSIIAGLILIILFVVYNRYRAKSKANKLLLTKNRRIQKQHHTLERTFAELQQKEAHLLESNATKDKFFSIIAHDLKNPIHAITLASDTLANKFQVIEGEKLLEMIQNIHKSGNHLTKMLENLLQWSRSQSGRIDFNPFRTQVKDLSEDAVNFLSFSASKKNITLVANVSSDIETEMDVHMMQVVFRNLVSNAIKFTNEGGYIEIGAKEIKNYIKLWVKDNGVGMTEEEQNKLFRIDVHHTTKGTDSEIGTGLGLILCKEFIERHGGKIWVKSKKGEGSTFFFTLPLK